MHRRIVPLRLKLLLAFLLVTAVAVAAVGGIASARTSASLLDATGRTLRARAESEAGVIGAALDNQLVRLRAIALGRALLAQISSQNQSYAGDPAAVVAERDSRWAAAPDDDTLIIEVTRSMLARDLGVSAALDSGTVELMLTDRFGALVAAASRTSDYDQSDEEWWQLAVRHGFSISPPLYDESAGDFGLIIAVAIREPSGALAGVLRSTYHVESLSELLGEADFGDTGRAELVLGESGAALGPGGAHQYAPAERDVIARARAVNYTIGEIAGVRDVVAVAPVLSSPEVATLGWELLLLQSHAEALAPVSAARVGALGGAMLALLGAGVVGLGLAELIVRPIRRITVAAERIAAGDLGERLNLDSGDEVGRLAGSFDHMAAALSERIAAEQAAQAERLALQEQVIAAQERRIEELAAPVIPLGAATLLLPLIGGLDERRADYVLRTVLAAVAEQRARRVLLDLTGVREADAGVAAALLRIAAGVRLLGAQAALIGLRPQVARAIAALELDLAGLPVYATLEAALAVGGSAQVGPLKVQGWAVQG